MNPPFRSVAASLLIFLLFLLVVGFIPLFPCPSEHGDVYALRMKYSRHPGRTPAEAAALQAYADADLKCEYCTRERRVGAIAFPLKWLDGLFSVQR